MQDCKNQTLIAALHFLVGEEQKAYCNARGLLVQAEREVRSAIAAFTTCSSLRHLEWQKDTVGRLKASLSRIRERRKKGMYGLCFGKGVHDHNHERIWRNGTAMAATVYRL